MVEFAPGWRRHAKALTEIDLAALAERLRQLKESFGKPHQHAGLGLRRLRGALFEFRLSRDLRVLFLFLKPNRFRLEMVGDHDQVRKWIKDNS